MKSSDIHFMQVPKTVTNKSGETAIQFWFSHLAGLRHNVEIVIVYGNFSNRAKIRAKTCVFMALKELKFVSAIAPVGANILVNLDTIVRTENNITSRTANNCPCFPRLFSIDIVDCVDENIVTMKLFSQCISSYSSLILSSTLH